MFERYQWVVNPSRFWWVPCCMWVCIALFVLLGAFRWQAQVLFLMGWCVLSAYYWFQLKATSHYSQLTLDKGTLILRFNNGHPPELIHLIGTQRILPWLVELTVLREDGKRYRWAIAADTMSRQDFRRLKVFVAMQT